MQQPHPASANVTRGLHAWRPLLLSVLVLLTLFAGLWQAGAQLSSYDLAGTRNSAPAEERQGGERNLEEQSPAKLRRASTVRTVTAARPQTTAQLVAVQPAPIRFAPTHAALPAANSLGHPLPSLRRHRGQAPPLA